MVYCKLIKKSNDFATYNIGTTVDDMSGEVIFFKDMREPELLKQAKNEPVRTIHIARIYRKYSEDFASGNYRENLAYEIG